MEIARCGACVGEVRVNCVRRFEKAADLVRVASAGIAQAQEGGHLSAVMELEEAVSGAIDNMVERQQATGCTQSPRDFVNNLGFSDALVDQAIQDGTLFPEELGE